MYNLIESSQQLFGARDGCLPTLGSECHGDASPRWPFMAGLAAQLWGVPSPGSHSCPLVQGLPQLQGVPLLERSCPFHIQWPREVGAGGGVKTQTFLSTVGKLGRDIHAGASHTDFSGFTPQSHFSLYSNLLPTSFFHRCESLISILYPR